MSTAIITSPDLIRYSFLDFLPMPKSDFIIRHDAIFAGIDVEERKEDENSHFGCRQQ
jgi:hypothetical protein